MLFMSSLTYVEDIEVKQGWRPGAITKRLKRKLNQAKLRSSVVENIKQKKRIKKRIEDKPMLIVTKVNGQYRVELQASPDSRFPNNQYSPLVYKIESANNNDKVRKRLKLQKQLIKEAINKVWSDPFHPEACEKTCYQAYKQAVGFPLDRDLYNENFEKPEIRSEDCGSYVDLSSCSSSEMDWEIHFTPPVMSYRILQK